MAFRTKEQQLNDLFQAWLGTAVMVTASIFAVLIFCDRMEMRFVSMPSIWYDSRGFHLLLCGGMFLCAAVLLKSPQRTHAHELTVPIFRTCELLTQPGCDLCNDAMQVLLGFQSNLPTITTVDISNDPQLTRQFGESIPVVILDGRVRFRGAVDPLLMQRMVDATQLRREYADAESEHRDASSGMLAS